ncbi:FAD-dependent oxidoreductase [Herbiconiux daphne]|uniref:FAD-dependent monooxygenase n=1 Tax=Herbiconiux daphne TaxID=2970914 RepID=A0ABT2H718_9MICO|nr:NAD(P)/FAD-dependent oxidoreductase [Herbiconiux daphne]MCS5735722.1 FAD-dependent monooxygenase [Herbiconiux daphne]
MTDPKDNASAEVSVTVIGAGIGGVACAAILHRAGFTVDLYDQALAFGEVGGTITIDSFSLGVLQSWGLADGVRQYASDCSSIELRKMSGEFVRHSKFPGLSDLGIDVEGREGYRELFGIQRSDLHAELLKHIPAERTHTGMRLSHVVDRGDRAEAHFDSGEVVISSALVGADGIRSTVRRLFSDVKAKPADATICRGIVPVNVLPPGWPNDRMRRWEHVRPDGSSTNALFAPTRGGGHVGVDTSLYQGDLLEDLGDAPVPVERILATYPADTDPVVLNAMRIGMVNTRAYRLFDLPPIDEWSGDSVTLLGDAAHAMRPLLGQGANQAIQDADELARCLSRQENVTAALRAYETVRKPFTQALARAARNVSPEYNRHLTGTTI